MVQPSRARFHSGTPGCVERWMASTHQRRRVVPHAGDTRQERRARCQRQPSRDTSVPRRSLNSCMCPQKRSVAGRRRAGCPISVPWVATDATPTPRSGRCWKPCPGHPRASHPSRPSRTDPFPGGSPSEGAPTSIQMLRLPPPDPAQMCSSCLIAFQLRKWSPRSDSNRRPSDYESKSIRPACAAQTRSGCSRQRGRLLSAFLTCGVTAGGMTGRMTRPAQTGPPDRRLPSDCDRKIAACRSPDRFHRSMTDHGSLRHRIGGQGEQLPWSTADSAAGFWLGDVRFSVGCGLGWSGLGPLDQSPRVQRDLELTG
jgi:hypothetical protein